MPTDRLTIFLKNWPWPRTAIDPTLNLNLTHNQISDPNLHPNPNLNPLSTSTCQCLDRDAYRSHTAPVRCSAWFGAWGQVGQAPLYPAGEPLPEIPPRFVIQGHSVEACDRGNERLAGLSKNTRTSPSLSFSCPSLERIDWSGSFMRLPVPRRCRTVRETRLASLCFRMAYRIPPNELM